MDLSVENLLRKKHKIGLFLGISRRNIDDIIELAENTDETIKISAEFSNFSIHVGNHPNVYQTYVVIDGREYFFGDPQAVNYRTRNAFRVINNVNDSISECGRRLDEIGKNVEYTEFKSIN